MPHLERTDELLKLLKLEKVPAHKVQEGDVIWHQGRTALVTKIETHSHPHPNGPFLEFEREPSPRDPDEYERAIVCRRTEAVLMVPRDWLKETNHE